MSRVKTNKFSKSSKKSDITDWNLFLREAKDDFLKNWTADKSMPAKLADFRHIKSLGRGSFGKVELVVHDREKKLYAMKIMKKEKVVKRKQVEHTHNEKRVLTSCRFPFIVQMCFCFKDNTRIYFVMPFIAGGEMFVYLRKVRKFDETLSRFYAAQVLLALEYLHYLDVVHRDLKPENILIDTDGYLKISDMGFCKLVSARTWTLCGTSEYMAPEIILEKGYGKSVDWWAFGILIYEMLAGYPPFSSHDPMKLYEKIVIGKYKLPKQFGSDLKDLLKNILQVDLTRRFGNLKDGVEDIKRHTWFKDTNWLAILNKKISAPYIPQYERFDNLNNNIRYRNFPVEMRSLDRFQSEFAFI
ncbi:cAMP-dependent protein kinase catalytic subunit 1-like [Periplaneta americana]|uniref:cAMP-dependent protein kinase catalytic subunit 1-like n=1 Tax=Periplaneta americana TaxID=6978 RepID=UPI0037E8D44D